jgi:hypothetical protein
MNTLRETSQITETKMVDPVGPGKLKAASGLLLLAVALFLSSAAIAGNKIEKQCYDYVQDKINWNYDHNARGDPKNVEELCKGTTEYKEPGECFHRVMHGGSYGNDGINWGGGTHWKWRNAVTLCAGTDSAENRIECFKNRIEAGEVWNTAIAQCVSLPNVSRRSDFKQVDSGPGSCPLSLGIR